MIVQPPPTVPPPIRPAASTVSVRVAPESVTVGDPFVVEVSTEAGAGVIVRFPATPDSAARVALRAPAEVPQAGSRLPNGRQRWVARYPMSAWDVGDVAIPLGPVTVGSEAVPVFARVMVRSVLPADTAQRVPQPPRPPVAWPSPWWIPFVLAAIVAAVLASLLTFGARWRRRRPVRRATAIARARDGLETLDAERWIARGEYVHAVDGVGSVLQRYLRERWAETALLDGTVLPPGATTGEVAQRLREVGWPSASAVVSVLATIDSARFAPAPIEASTARAIAAAVPPLLDEMEQALVARELATTPSRRAA
jgi:hypothetical protein